MAGISDAEGNMPYKFPVVHLSVNEAILQTCPERLECLLLCPSANVSVILLSVILLMCFSFYVPLGIELI